MALLLGTTTLNAAGYELVPYGGAQQAGQRGSLVIATPAGQAVVPFNAATTLHSTSTALTSAQPETPLPTVIQLVTKANNSSAKAVWDELEMANAAAEALNPELMAKIQKLQDELLEQSKSKFKFKFSYPQLFPLNNKLVYETFQKALGQTAKDLAPARAAQL